MVATDFGGVLPWTKQLAAIVLVSACAIAATARLISVGCPSEVRLPPRSFSVTAVLLALTLYATLQTVPLSPAVVAWLSPASHAAYTTWAGEILGDESIGSFPISIAAFDSRHSIACLTIALALSIASVVVFQVRGRIVWFLAAIATGACSIAVIGLARKLNPGFQLWSFQSGGEGSPFGTFLNRNNAALALNLGIGSAIGLVLWRQTVLAPPSAGLSRTRSNRVAGKPDLTWLRNPAVLFALGSIFVCMIGLIACGSRGGLLSMAIAGSVTLFLLRGKIGSLGGVLLAVVATAAIVFVILRTDTLGNQALEGDTIEQIGSTVSDGGDRFSTDTRLAHWPDGFRAGIQHFPAGSGLATYGYAYLPWQQTSPWRLCLHADNLWLEMFVELGLGGLVITALSIWLIVRSLSRLARSPDPIDQGLWGTGCYVLIVILVSQLFDFGLILPANLFATVPLLAMIVARGTIVIVNSAVSHAQPVEGRNKNAKPKLVLLERNQRWWSSPQFLRERLLQSVAAAILLLISIPAINRLRMDAETDYTVRTFTHDFKRDRADSQRLDELIESTRNLAQKHPDPALLDMLTELDFQQGRLLELTSMNAGRLPDTQQAKLYSATSRSRRRLGWRASVPQLSNGISDGGQPVMDLPIDPRFVGQDSPYTNAYRSANASLRSRPLGLTPRMNQVILEFVHQSPQRSRIAIRQSAGLFRNTPELQLRFGSTAANHHDYETAISAWQRTIAIDENMLGRVLGRAMRFPEFPIHDLVADQPELMEKANEFLRSRSYPLPNPPEAL